MDYCLLDNHAAHILQECVTLDHHPLNLSDHLPLSVCLDLTTLVQNKPPRSPKTNWKRAISDGSIEGYQQQVSTYFSNLLTHHNFSDLPIAERTAQLDHEIRTSAEAILQAAQQSLPCFKPHRQKRNTSRIHHSTQSAVRVRLRGTHGVVVADPGVALCTKKCVKGRKMSDPTYVAPEHERKDLGFKSVIVYFVSVTLVDFSFLAITHLAES